MASSFSHFFFIYLAMIPQSFTERRIKDGMEVTSNKRYAVYFLRAESAPTRYHGWLCGGAILSEEFILTSAACVQDVQHLYVVAGYKKYVSTENMDVDKCVKAMKKKVILTCVPRNYQFDYNRTELWAKADLAVVKVESSLDFQNKSYETLCSYKPEAIEYNTEKDFPKVGDDVMALGWGHNKMFRKESDPSDLNLETLHYAVTQVMNVSECLKHYNKNDDLARSIVTSMICTLDPGKLNETGHLIAARELTVTGCIPEIAKLRGAVGPMCQGEAGEEMVYEDEYYEPAPVIDRVGNLEPVVGDPDPEGEGRPAPVAEYGLESFVDGGPEGYYYDVDKAILDLVNETRREVRSHRAYRKRNDTDTKKPHRRNRKRKGKVANKEYRRIEGDVDYKYDDVLRQARHDEHSNSKEYLDTPGICQNDHGGPLVAWRGGREVLVAIATLFRLDGRQHCIGPYLFTKTWCNGKFIDCIINQNRPEYRPADNEQFEYY